MLKGVRYSCMASQGEPTVFVECPHCGGGVVVAIRELNCRIFRHGICTNTFRQMNPHASQQECLRLIETNAVIGCAKPFRIDGDSISTYVAVACEYI